MTQRHIVFSHGQESGPWGRKITVLAEVARAQGWEAHSVDYRGIQDPAARVAKLLDFCAALEGTLVLAGSSVGGYVSVAGAARLQPRGVFVVAPALYHPQLLPLAPGLLECPVTLIHGWGDEVVPYEGSVRFAQAERQATLHLMPGDHLLHEPLPLIGRLLAGFLLDLEGPVVNPP